MNSKIFHVLFICTHNATRSIMAEAIMNTLGAGRFQAHSAGSRACGEIHPLTLEVLHAQRHNTACLRSKSWQEFAQPSATKMDFIFTVCDQAAGESCPAWPGQPISAHWGFADPTHVEDALARQKAFKQTYIEISNRIRIFLSLPVEKLERRSLQSAVREIGHSSNTYPVRQAQPHLLASVQQLLTRCSLPANDLTSQHLIHFLVITHASIVIACVGIEPYGNVALLRSLAVSPAMRGRGWGGRLLRAIEEHAERIGVSNLYLLTVKDAEFFEGHGYKQIDRSSVPPSIQSTAQFSGLCPSSATCMVKAVATETD